jgi:hypothetical protein
MGEVSRARDRRLERDVVIKAVPEGFNATPTVSTASTRGPGRSCPLHPYIREVRDVVAQHDRPDIITDLLLGGTLRKPGEVLRFPFTLPSTAHFGTAGV